MTPGGLVGGALAAVVTTGCCTAIGGAVGSFVPRYETVPLPAGPPPIPPLDGGSIRMLALAKDAARNGDCDIVRSLDSKLLAHDPQFHATAFVFDPDIHSCRGRQRSGTYAGRGASTGLAIDVVAGVLMLGYFFAAGPGFTE